MYDLWACENLNAVIAVPSSQQGKIQPIFPIQSEHISKERARSLAFFNTKRFVARSGDFPPAEREDVYWKTLQDLALAAGSRQTCLQIHSRFF